MKYVLVTLLVAAGCATGPTAAQVAETKMKQAEDQRVKGLADWRVKLERRRDSDKVYQDCRGVDPMTISCRQYMMAVDDEIELARERENEASLAALQRRHESATREDERKRKAIADLVRSDDKKTTIECEKGYRDTVTCTEQ